MLRSDLSRSLAKGGDLTLVGAGEGDVDGPEVAPEGDGGAGTGLTLDKQQLMAWMAELDMGFGRGHCCWHAATIDIWSLRYG